MARRKHNERDEAVPGGPQGLRRRGKGPTYYLKRQYRGQRYTISLGPSLPQARMKAQQIINAMERGDFRLSDFQAERVEVIRALTEAADRLATKKQHSPKSRASYSSRIDHFLAFLRDRHPRVRYLSELSAELGEQYVEWRRGQLVTRSGKARPETKRHHPAAQTVHDDVRRLRALFRVIEADEQIRSNPFAQVSVQVMPRDRRVKPMHLTQAQIRDLLSAAKAYDSASHGPGARSTFRGLMHDMVALYVLTGLRKEELIYLPWSHVDLDWGKHGRIEVTPVDESVTLSITPPSRMASRLNELAERRKASEPLFENASQMRAHIPKNYASQEPDALLSAKASAWNAATASLRIRTRVTWKQKATPGEIPLVHDSRLVLDRRLAERTDSPFVFPHPDGGRLRSDPLPEFKKLLREAKIPQSTRLHDLRHTFGFTLRDRGVPLETIMGLMRHANIEETMVYAKYSLAEGARGIQSLEGLTG
ncbi:MAG: hypothetical protein Phyf2KO_16940 [Phycisphaerales bacterium]